MLTSVHARTVWELLRLSGPKCKLQDTVCEEQRIDYEDKAWPCVKAKLEYTSCFQAHNEEMVANAKYKIEAELIDEIIQKYEAEKKAL